jgi:acetolactate synthase small subunit
MPPRRLEMLPIGLVEVSRTGIVAIQRGPEGM